MNAPLPKGAYVHIRTNNGGEAFGTLSCDYVPSYSVTFTSAATERETEIPGWRIASVTRRYLFTMTCVNRQTAASCTIRVSCVSQELTAATAELTDVFGVAPHEVTSVVPA